MDTERKLTVDDVKAILEAFKPWINQKPELDPADYGCHREQRAYTANKEWWENWRSMQKELRDIAS